MKDTFAERFKAERQRAGLSQDDIAEVCKNRDGEMPSRSAIAQWENPHGTRPTFDNLLAAAKRLGVSLDYLVGLSNRRDISQNSAFVGASEESPVYKTLSESALGIAKKWQALPPATRSAIEAVINSVNSARARKSKGE